MLFSSLYYHYFPLIFSYNLEGGSWPWYTTTYEISAYHHWRCEFESRSGRGAQHYVIKFVSDWRQVSGFQRVLRFPPWYKQSCISVRGIHFTSFYDFSLGLWSVSVCGFFFSFLCFLCFWFFFWIICVSFKSVSMTFRQLKVNYVMRYICLPVI
jgi:hypothetical protein